MASTGEESLQKPDSPAVGSINSNESASSLEFVVKSARRTQPKHGRKDDKKAPNATSGLKRHGNEIDVEDSFTKKWLHMFVYLFKFLVGSAVILVAVWLIVYLMSGHVVSWVFDLWDAIHESAQRLLEWLVEWLSPIIHESAERLLEWLAEWSSAILDFVEWFYLPMILVATILTTSCIASCFIKAERKFVKVAARETANDSHAPIIRPDPRIRFQLYLDDVHPSDIREWRESVVKKMKPITAQDIVVFEKRIVPYLVLVLIALGVDGGQYQAFSSAFTNEPHDVFYYKRTSRGSWTRVQKDVVIDMMRNYTLLCSMRCARSLSRSSQLTKCG
jgi:hypothetical protein